MRIIDADALLERENKCFLATQNIRAGYEVRLLIHTTLQKLLKAAPTIEQPTWISCEDGLPETIVCSAGTAYSEAILLFTTGKKVLIGIFDGERFLSDGIDYWDAEHDEVIHWMPLPQPPKGDE